MKSIIALMASIILCAGCHPGTGPAPDRNTFTSVCQNAQCNNS